MRPPVFASHGPHARRLAALASIATVLAIGVSAVQQARPPITPPSITGTRRCGCRRTDLRRHPAGRRDRGELRRPGRRLRRPAGHAARAQSIGQHARRRPGPHRPDRQHAHGHLHEEGTTRFDDDGRALYGPVPTNVVFRGFGGTVRGDRTTATRWSGTTSLAKRWLIVMPIFRRAAARPDQPAGWTARELSVSQPAWTPRANPGPAVRDLPDRRRLCRDTARQAPDAAAGRRPPRARPADRPLRDVLRGEHRARPAGPLLSLRVPAAALPRLSEAGRSGPTATTCRRAPATTRSPRRSRPRSTPASPTGRRCSAASPPPSSASSSTTSGS